MTQASGGSKRRINAETDADVDIYNINPGCRALVSLVSELDRSRRYQKFKMISNTPRVDLQSALADPHCIQQVANNVNELNELDVMTLTITVLADTRQYNPSTLDRSAVLLFYTNYEGVQRTWAFLFSYQ